ncbi:MAG: hypothetical protein AVDCRST_MAG87-291, partial [uncultured Thermomicrobiales bacterium]
GLQPVGAEGTVQGRSADRDKYTTRHPCGRPRSNVQHRSAGRRGPIAEGDRVPGYRCRHLNHQYWLELGGCGCSSPAPSFSSPDRRFGAASCHQPGTGAYGRGL